MKGCDDCRDNLQLYFDKELRGHDLVEFRAHLEKCAVCQQALKEEEELSRLLRRARPLYSAPEALRKRVLEAVTEPATESLPGLRPKGKH
jgi:mycothiol system anti-sigma-R factor